MMTRFSTLNPDGTESNVRDIPQSAMLECPHCIIVADHYRQDNTCRCDDETHTEMLEWGYRWDEVKGEWIAPPEDE